MTTPKNSRRLCDLSALAVWTTIYAWFAVRLPHLSVFTDEGTYLLYVRRFMQGYAPIVDDWGAEQLCAPFQYLPYKLYTSITGGSDGAILFIRYCYLCICAVLFWFLYLRLRDRGFWGLLAVAVFSAYVPVGIFTLNYYTMQAQGLAVFCAVMFLSKNGPTLFGTVFAGFVFACTVMTEPPLVILYALFSCLALLRAVLRKKGGSLFASYDFILNGKTWRYLTLGCGICIALFLLWLAFTGGLGDTVRALPAFFRNLGYDMADENETRLSYYFLTYIKPVFREIRKVYGITALVAAPVFVAAAAVCRYRIKKINAVRIVFLASLIFYGGLLLVGAVRFLPFVGNPDNKPYWAYLKVTPTVPLLCLGLIWHILRQNKNRKLFCVWCVGAAASAMIDFASEISVCASFAAAIPAAILMLPETAKELRQPQYEAAATTTEKRSKKQRGDIGKIREKNAAIRARAVENKLCKPLSLYGAIVVPIFCLTAAFCVFLEGWVWAYKPFETTIVRIEEGAYRGLYVSSEKKTAYRKMDADLKTLPADATLHIVNNMPELYLDAGCGISVCDPWYYCDESYDRQLEWWRLHPDRLPDYIYIPRYWHAAEDPDFSDEYYLNTVFSSYDRNFEYERTDGAGGVILKITKTDLGG